MIRIVSFFVFAAIAFSQPLEGLRKFLVTVEGGSGIVVSKTKNTVLIVTAGHVLAQMFPNVPNCPGNVQKHFMAPML